MTTAGITNLLNPYDSLRGIEGEISDSRLTAIIEHSESLPLDVTIAMLGGLEPPQADKTIFLLASLHELTKETLDNPDALSALHETFRRIIHNPSNPLEEVITVFTDPSFKSWKELGMILYETHPSTLEAMKNLKPSISGGRTRAVIKLYNERTKNPGHNFHSISLLPKGRENPAEFNRIPDIYYDNIKVENHTPISETPGLFSAENITPSSQLLKDHPLSKFCHAEPFSARELAEIFAHPLLKAFDLVAAPSGTFPAAFPYQLETIEPREFEERYASLNGGLYEVNSWFRDDAIAVACLLSQGKIWQAGKALRSKLHYLGKDHLRENIIRHHLDPWNAPDLYEHGGAPPIKARINPYELQDLDHTWDHRQGDALGSIIALGYELLTLGWYKPKGELGGIDIHNFDLKHLGPHSKDEHILRAIVKSMYYFDAPHRWNTGPWEDKPESERATCVGATLWATRAALTFHRRHGFHQLGVSGDMYGDLPDFQQRTFEEQLVFLSQSCKESLARRIPDTAGAFATESDGRPLDSAVILLLSLYRLPLTRNQEDAILRTWYANMGEVAVRRWVEDTDATGKDLRGDDPYMGMNYHSRSENPPHFHYFSDDSQQGDRSPEWPAILCWGGIAIARRILNTIPTNPSVAEKDYLVLSAIIKKALVTILPKTSDLTVQNTGETFTRNKGKIPEVYFRSTFAADGITPTKEHWEANHYCGLTMAHAPFAQLLNLAYYIRSVLDANKENQNTSN